MEKTAQPVELKQRETRAGELYRLKLNQVVVDKKFNAREDFGDIEELAQSIKQNGIEVPLQGYKKDNHYVLLDGERRFRAVQLLAQQGVEVDILMRPVSRNIPEEDRVLKMITTNGGKELNLLEKANVLNRLKALGLSDTTISERTGWAQPFVSFLRTIDKAPTNIKRMIRENVVAASEVVRLFRENENNTEAVYEQLQNATNGGTVKATRKKIEATVGKVNSIVIFKKAVKNKMNIPVKNIELFNLLNRFINSDVTEEEIAELFFED